MPAATDESTPPLIATITFSFRTLIDAIVTFLSARVS
jgi:hypothetical protein